MVAFKEDQKESRKQGECHKCGIIWHYKKDCRSKCKQCKKCNGRTSETCWTGKKLIIRVYIVKKIMNLKKMHIQNQT